MLWNPRLKLCSLLEPHYTPQCSSFIGLGPICIPDQAPFIVWVEPVLTFTLVRKVDCERCVLHGPRLFHITKVGGFLSALLSVDPCLGFCLNHAIATVGDILTAPVTVSQASFCNLLCSILKYQNMLQYADSVSNNFFMNFLTSHSHA